MAGFPNVATSRKHDDNNDDSNDDFALAIDIAVYVVGAGGDNAHARKHR